MQDPKTVVEERENVEAKRGNKVCLVLSPLLPLFSHQFPFTRCVLLLICLDSEPDRIRSIAMDLKIPPSLKHEHGEMRASLEIAGHAQGKCGEAAREVARLLFPHFKREEEYALPPLDTLSVLAGGGIPESADKIIAKVDRLKVELAEMLKEHQAIAKALEALYDAATDDQRQELARFARKLLLHAQMEEQIYYPAALVIGDYLKLRTGKG
jgi:hypothetical protein